MQFFSLFFIIIIIMILTFYWNTHRHTDTYTSPNDFIQSTILYATIFFCYFPNVVLFSIRKTNLFMFETNKLQIKTKTKGMKMNWNENKEI